MARESTPSQSHGHESKVVIALDAEGGDKAPGEIVAGAAMVASPELEVVMVGREEVVKPLVAAAPSSVREHLKVVPCGSVISFHDEPAWAVRNRPDSSIVVGARLVAEGKAKAFVSAGSTGAMVAAGLLVVKRVPGVKRPAILVLLPGRDGPVALLDAGANADCRPEHLLEFALMGSAFVKAVLGIAEPRVGLLNIGEESSKGNELAMQAHRLIGTAPVRFVGNVEGRGLLYNQADVVVTDGFTGNVALKLLEGTALYVIEKVREAARSTYRSRIGGLLLRSALRTTLRSLDPEEYGGTYLLGVKGLLVICHGSSSRRAISNALRFAARAVRSGLVESLPCTISAALQSQAD